MAEERTEGPQTGRVPCFTGGDVAQLEGRPRAAWRLGTGGKTEAGIYEPR